MATRKRTAATIRLPVKTTPRATRKSTVPKRPPALTVLPLLTVTGATLHFGHNICVLRRATLGFAPGTELPRSEPQWRHLIASALIVSAQNGHFFSSAIAALLSSS